MLSSCLCPARCDDLCSGDMLQGSSLLSVLTWIVFTRYLVFDVFLFPVFVWKAVEGVYCLVFLLFYTADTMLIGKFFVVVFCFCFVLQGNKQ